MDLVCTSCGELMEDAGKKNMRIRVLASDPTKVFCVQHILCFQFLEVTLLRFFVVARALTYLTQVVVVEILPAISYMYSRYEVSYMHNGQYCYVMGNKRARDWLTPTLAFPPPLSFRVFHVSLQKVFW